MNDDDRYTRITLRIPRELHKSLSDAAERTSKSLNAEIVGRLQGSFDPAVGSSGKIAELENAIAVTRFASDYLIEQSAQQISMLARSNEAARSVSEELLRGLGEVTQIARDLLDGELLDRGKAALELNLADALQVRSEQRLEDTKLPELKRLSQILLEKAEKLEAIANATPLDSR